MPKLTPGSARCQCGVCGLYFTHASSFSKHRVGLLGTRSRRCLTEEEMKAVGFVLQVAGYWAFSPKPREFRSMVRAQNATFPPGEVGEGSMPPRASQLS